MLRGGLQQEQQRMSKRGAKPDATTPHIGWRAAEWAVSAVILLAPVLPLLLPTHRINILDWHNVMWTVGYAETYVSQHGFFPAALNTDRVCGQPQPVFYGPLLYP